MLKFLYLVKFYIVVKFLFKGLNEAWYEFLDLVCDLRELGVKEETLLKIVKDNRQTFFTANTRIIFIIKKVYLESESHFKPTLREILLFPFYYLTREVKFFKELKYILYDIKYGIENIFFWFGVIWRDRDWDEFFILIILRKKLKSVSKYYSIFSLQENADKKIAELEKCVNLIDGILDRKCLLDSGDEAQSIIDELFSSMSKNITTWWD